MLLKSTRSVRLNVFAPLAVSATLLWSAAAGGQTLRTFSYAVPNRLVEPINESSRVTLSGTMHPLATKQNDKGAISDGLKLDRLQILMRRSDAQEAELKQLISDLHTPGSPSYRKWLTPDDFGKRFGPSDADLVKLESWLQSHGFSVVKLNPGRQTLEVAGTAGQFRDTFKAQIHSYQVKGETHYANAAAPQIPVALAPIFGGFASLNNFRLKSHMKRLGSASFDPLKHEVKPDWTIGSGSNYNLVLAPADFAVQYQLPTQTTPGVNDGTGQSIAIVNESNIDISLVNRFRTLFGLPANPPQIIIDGNDPGIDGINNADGENGASGEAYLDVEWAGAVAPGATVNLVIAADTILANGLDLAAERAVYSNVSPIISISFGSCEASLGSDNNFWSTLWEQAAAQGITVAVSSGDNGSAGCDNPDAQVYAVFGQAVNGIASTPYNVAVGGTDFYYANGTSDFTRYWNTATSASTNANPSESLNASAAPIPEQAWNNSQFGSDLSNYYEQAGNSTISAGSGGPSTAGFATGNTFGPYPKPAWQRGFGDSVRDLPDVSLFAASGANNSYYPICADDGDCEPVSGTSPSSIVQFSGVGGTSAAAPSFAGIMALVDQQYGRQGQANFVLYPLATQFPAVFHDVVHGTITVPCNTETVQGAIDGTTYSFPPTDCLTVSPVLTGDDPNFGTSTEGEIGLAANTPAYNATSGYDLATGLGTINAKTLIADWNKVRIGTTQVTLTPSQTSFPHGTAVTISGSVTGTGTPTGDVALVTDSLEPVKQGDGFFTLSGGSYSGSVGFLPGGSYDIWGTYGGDATNASSSSIANKVPITVTPEASALPLSVYTLDPNSSTYTTVAANGSVSYGSQLILSAQPGPKSGASNDTVPTGSVVFNDAGKAIDTAVVNSAGDAEAFYAFGGGSHTVSANYSGDSSYSASQSSPATFTVTPNVPVFNFYVTNSDSSGNIYGPQQTFLNIVISNANNYTGSAAAPAGTITMTGAPAGSVTTATLSPAVNPASLGGQAEGVATLSIPANTTGNVNLSFQYTSSDTTKYSSFTAPGGGQFYQLPYTTTGAPYASTTAVTASASASSPAALVSISGSISGQSGRSAPTGQIGIYGPGVSFGTVDLTAPTSGSVTSFGPFYFDATAFIQGSNQFTIQYFGDNNYAPSAGTVTVANPLSDFQMVPLTTIINVPSTGSAIDTIQLTSTNSFAGPITLTCRGSSGVTCSVNPSSATLAAGGQTSAVLTVNTAGVNATGTYNVSVTGSDSTGNFVHTLGFQVTVPHLATSGLRFVPLTPCRVADTRNSSGAFGGPEAGAGVSREFDLPESGCGIPSTAVAYSLNVTVVPDKILQYLTLWPSGTAQPYVSTLNSYDGRIKANAAIVPAGSNGGVSVFTSDSSQVILDVDGYFVPATTSSALAFYPLAPCRVADTRTATGALGGPFLGGQQSRSFPVGSSACGIPANAQAYSLNVTAVPHSTLQYLTTWPTGQTQPYVSTLNAPTGAVTANAAIVPAGTSGAVSLFVSDDADVILDINGYFAPAATGGLSLYTAAPCRVVDTRGGAGAFNGSLQVPVEASACALPAAAQAYVLNATVVPPAALIYLTLWPDGENQPYVSTLNADDAAITSNLAIVPTANGKVDAFSSNPTNLILDISSYFAP